MKIHLLSFFGRSEKKKESKQKYALILSVELNSEGNFIYFNRKIALELAGKVVYSIRVKNELSDEKENGLKNY
jgi:hypothetical protein